MKECRHIIVTYVGRRKDLESKLPHAKCIDCEKIVYLDKNYSLIGFYDGKERYRRQNGK